MTKYHISKNGEPDVCSARIQCRLADESEHYSTPEEARTAYEEVNAAKSLKSHRKLERYRRENNIAGAGFLKADTPMQEYTYHFKEIDGKLKVYLEDEDKLPIGAITVDPENEREAIDQLAFASWSPGKNTEGFNDKEISKLAKAHDVWKENSGTHEDRRLAFNSDAFVTTKFDHKLNLEELREISKLKKSKKLNKKELDGVKSIVKKLDDSPAARKTFEALH